MYVCVYNNHISSFLVSTLSPRRIVILIFVYLFSCVLLLYFIPKEGLNVDRWKMIYTFWNAVENGVSPYSAKDINSGNYPGPMPFYFILYYPFYLIKEPALLTIISIIFVFIYYYKKCTYKNFCLLVLFILSSVSVYWEILTRSSIVFNSFLFAFFVFYLEDMKKFSKRIFYFTAIVGGFLFSTRNVYILILIPLFIYFLFKEDFKIVSLLKWGGVFILSFAFTFLPFILIDPLEFLVMNPFVIQSSVLLPFYVIVIFIVISVVGGFFCNDYDDVVFLGGLLFFLTGITHIIYFLLKNGTPDISYTLFCFPFFLHLFIKYRVITFNKNEI